MRYLLESAADLPEFATFWQVKLVKIEILEMRAKLHCVAFIICFGSQISVTTGGFKLETSYIQCSCPIY